MTKDPTFYTAVSCPVAGCTLTATHHHGPDVERAAATIREKFGSMRTEFLSDPGGFLSVTLTDEEEKALPDELWADAIAIVEEEWAFCYECAGSGIVPRRGGAVAVECPRCKGAGR